MLGTTPGVFVVWKGMPLGGKCSVVQTSVIVNWNSTEGESAKVCISTSPVSGLYLMRNRLTSLGRTLSGQSQGRT